MTPITQLHERPNETGGPAISSKASDGVTQVLDHQGNPIPADAEFFVPAPAWLGTVTSAYSTLKLGQDGRSPMNRFIMALSAAMVVGTSGGLAVYRWVDDELKSQIAFLVIIAAALAFGAVLLYSTFTPRCTYVGDRGVAIYRQRGSRKNKIKSEGVVFDNAAELRTSITDSYHGAAYTGTHYSFTWTSPAGTPLFSLHGTTRFSSSALKPSDLFNFGAAAERAWSVYQLNRSEETLQRQGYLQFNLLRSDWVRVGPGFIEFCLNGSTDRVEADQIKKLQLTDGKFCIVHKDASWWRGTGTYRFTYSGLANAKLFLLAVERLLGHPLG